MPDPRTAPFNAVLLTEVATAQELNPDDPTHTGGLFYLIRGHFDVRFLG